MEFEALSKKPEPHESYYPATSLIELEGVIVKEVRRRNLGEIPKQAVDGLDFIVYGGKINVDLPVGDDLTLIYKVFKLGWRDIFDATLYATAKRLEAKALSLDAAFKAFLKECDLDHEILITHEEP